MGSSPPVPFTFPPFPLFFKIVASPLSGSHAMRALSTAVFAAMGVLGPKRLATFPVPTEKKRVLIQNVVPHHPLERVFQGGDSPVCFDLGIAGPDGSLR